MTTGVPVDSLPPQNRTEFDAAADRAREAGTNDRGPVMAFVDRARSVLDALLGR